MYENKFPEVDSVVMIQVVSIAEMGAYVQLLEYNNIEGNAFEKRHFDSSANRFGSAFGIITETYSFDHQNHQSGTPRTRSGSQSGPRERQIPPKTSQNDSAGYIDLSKRRVSPEDVAACEERFTKSKMVFESLKRPKDCF